MKTKRLEFPILVFCLIVLVGCRKNEYIEVSTFTEFKTHYNGTAGGGSSDFIGVIYCGKSTECEYIVFQHSLSGDVVVKVPFGVLKLNGGMKLTDFEHGIPLGVMMNKSDYESLRF